MKSITENGYVVIRISKQFYVLHMVKTSKLCEDRLRQGYAYKQWHDTWSRRQCTVQAGWNMLSRCSVLLIAGSVLRRFTNTNKRVEISSTYATNADPDGRAVYGVGLKPLGCWDRGFESRRGHGCSTFLFVFIVYVAAYTTRWTLVQRSFTLCVWVCLIVCDREI